MPETGSTEEFAVIEREQTSTSSEATAPVVKSRKAPGATPPAAREPTWHPPPKVDAPASDMTALVHSLSEFAAETGRPDLAQRLEHTHARLLDPDVRVIVVGEFKQGKSKLINALVNAPACPVDDDIATSVPTSVGYGEQPSAWIMTRDEDASTKPGTAVERQQVPLEELSDYVSERGNPGNERRIVSAEVLLPREILKGGLKLVDSPGVGGLDSSNALATLSALSSAHAVLLVSDASQEYTEPEVQFLKHAMRISPNVAAVLAKTDLYPEWRQIEQIDRWTSERGGRRADVLGLERLEAAGGRAAGPRAQRRVGIPGTRRAPAPRGARARRAAARAQRRA